MLLKDQVAVITGAGRGIGRAAALTLAGEGAHIILTGRNETELGKVKKEIEEKNGRADIFCVDVTKDEEIEEMICAVKEKQKRIDILINNAGISKEMPFPEMPMEIWDDIFSVNLRGTAVMIKTVLPVMMEQNRGNIINIGSAAALRGLPGSTAYSASKAGVVCLSQALGDELRSYGIRVNVLCPGPVNTEMLNKSEKKDFILAAGQDVFEPGTIANGILYLASDLSKGMNSQILTIRGINRW